MPANLNELGDQIQRMTPRTPAPAPEQPVMGGDDLMAKIQAHTSINNEELELAKRFVDSEKLVGDRINGSPDYAKIVMGRLQNLKGADFANQVMEEADQLKIQDLKAKYPDKFNSTEAARAAFVNEGTFHQMTRIMGGLGALIQGRPYEEVVREKAEEFRLLQKAFPGDNTIGRISAYLMPGSPVKFLFDKLSKIGIGATSTVLTKVANNPAALEKIVSFVGNRGFEAGAKAIEGGIAGGSAAAGIGFTTGTLGSGNQSINFDRGVDRAVAEGTSAAVFSAALPVIGALAEAGIDRFAPDLRRAITTGQKIVDDSVTKLTGTKAESLRAYNKDAKAIQGEASRENEIGQRFVDFLQSKRSGLPEIEQADQLLDSLPEVSTDRLMKYLRSYKPGADPANDAAVARLKEWATRFDAQRPGSTEIGFAGSQGGGRVSSRVMRQWVDDLQAAADGEFGKESNFYYTAVKIAARRARETIIEGAEDQIRGLMKNPANRGEFASVRSALINDKLDEVVPLLKQGLPQNASAGQIRAYMKNPASQADFDAIRSAMASGNAESVAGLLKPGFSSGALNDAKAAAMYSASMEKAAEKVGLLKYFSRKLGRTEEMMRDRAKDFITGVSGNRAEVTLERMKSLDARFGTNFAERAQLAGYARDIGNEGVPGLFTNIKTGKALTAPLIGLAKDTATGSPGIFTLAATVGSSPRAGAAMIGASDKISGFLRALLAKPEVLQRIANNAQAQEVRFIAKNIFDVWKKDGPASASGVARLVADTPYFYGLVHAFDIAERAEQRKNLGTALDKLNTQRGNQ